MSQTKKKQIIGILLSCKDFPIFDTWLFDSELYSIHITWSEIMESPLCKDYDLVI